MYNVKHTFRWYFPVNGVPTAVSTSLLGSVALNGATLTDVAAELDASSNQTGSVQLGIVVPNTAIAADMLELVVDLQGVPTAKIPFLQEYVGTTSGAGVWESLRGRTTGHVAADGVSLLHSDSEIEIDYDLANDNDFITLQQSVSANSQAANANAQAAAANAQAVAANAQAAAANAQAVALNAQGVADNAQDIASNTQAIGANTQAIAAIGGGGGGVDPQTAINTADILALQNAVAALQNNASGGGGSDFEFPNQ